MKHGSRLAPSRRFSVSQAGANDLIHETVEGSTTPAEENADPVSPCHPSGLTAGPTGWAASLSPSLNATGSVRPSTPIDCPARPRAPRPTSNSRRTSPTLSSKASTPASTPQTHPAHHRSPPCRRRRPPHPLQGPGTIHSRERSPLFAGYVTRSQVSDSAADSLDQPAETIAPVAPYEPVRVVPTRPDGWPGWLARLAGPQAD
jgi:hypothetical protein